MDGRDKPGHDVDRGMATHTIGIILNGATAHLGKPGDLVTIMSYAVLDEREAKKWKPRVIVLGSGNQIVNERGV